MSRRTKFGLIAAILIVVVGGLFFLTAANRNKRAVEVRFDTVKAQDLPTLLSKQREIATKFAEKATTRQQALAEMATESQAGFARWIEDATSLAGGKAA